MTKLVLKYSILLIVATLLAQVAGHAGSIIYYIGILLVYFPLREKIVVYKTKPLLIPIFIAMIIGLFMKPYSLYDVFKDAFYLFSPIIMLMLGEILAKKMTPKSFLLMIVIVGSFFSLINCFGNLMTSGFQIIIDPRSVRDGDNYYGDVNYFAMLSFFVLLYWKFFKKDQMPSNGNFLLFINTLAIYFSGSRSYWLVLLIIAFFLLYPFLKKRKGVFILIISLSITIVGAITISGGRTAELIKHSTEEMKVEDYTSVEDMNNNYRGYEAYMALSEYSRYSPVNKIFGGGMGATVDMGEYSPVGLQYLPVLHNGYPYLLIKMGIVGFIVFLLYFSILILRYRRWNTDIGDGNIHFWRTISYGSIISILVMHFSVNAIFNAEYNTSLIFVGFTLTHMAWQAKRKIQSKSR